MKKYVFIPVACFIFDTECFSDGYFKINSGCQVELSRNQPLSSLKLTENQKIDSLINFIRNLKDAVFIRNGDEHSATEAADHLQMKREKAGSKIKTAIDFIVHIASKSSVSGKPYLIKYRNGKTIGSMELLTEELKRIEIQQVKHE